MLSPAAFEEQLMSTATLNFTIGDRPPPEHEQRERTSRELVGAIAHVSFCDPDSGMVIARTRTQEAVKGGADVDELTRGGYFRFFGRWVEHHKYGWQFHFDTYTRWHFGE